MSRLVLTSALGLFVELALIRWVPAHALFLTFFTNVVLLGSFLGLALGLWRRREKDLFSWTPTALAVTAFAAHLVEASRAWLEPRLDVGGQSAPQLVFFGTEYYKADLSRFPIPIELLAGLFFLLAAACLYGVGQELGRRLEAAGGGTRAYGADLAGSLAGVVLFGLAAKLELQPFWWFLAAAAAAETLERSRRAKDPARVVRLGSWGAVLIAALLTGSGRFTAPPPGSTEPAEGFRVWSPYYRVDWFPPPLGDVSTNLIGHQRMIPLSAGEPGYALPHVLHLDAGGAPFKDVLVIGAGSGNDVARALRFGAETVDAVEIDPAIQRIGREAHPDKPYADPRVHPFVGDGRRFLRADGRKYDLIVYALVDSLVLHSGYSNIRLESYLFTSEALKEAAARLKPGGTLVLYNYYRTGWVAGRIFESLRDAFGKPPLVITTPHLPVVDERSPGGFTLFMAGDTGAVAKAFARSGVYRFDAGTAEGKGKNGFRQGPPKPGEAVAGCALSEVRPPAGLKPATDDWPFLYLRDPMIPGVTLRGMAVMGGLAFLVVWLLGGGAAGLSKADPRMFFLGAGFMLLETKAVVVAALWFGGTWVVNSFVFAGVLAALWGANALAGALKPKSLTPWYAGLFLSLAGSWLAAPGSAAAAALSFLPLLFAGVVFSTSYARSKDPAADFGVNVAGAMAGGLLENASMLVGFRGLALLAAGLYAASLLKSSRIRG